jgi:hypothetical protein
MTLPLDRSVMQAVWRLIEANRTVQPLRATMKPGGIATLPPPVDLFALAGVRRPAKPSTALSVKAITPAQPKQAVPAFSTPPPAPTKRRLKVFSFDPLLAIDPNSMGMESITLHLDWDDESADGVKLQPGPIGEYLEVIDYDPASRNRTKDLLRIATNGSGITAPGDLHPDLVNRLADDESHPEHFRSIDDLAYETLGNLALRMDNHINNTSLVIAFQLPSGEVLLFPGDAQAGNWKSWADLDKPLTFEKPKKTDAHELLANTVLYKVGHHGSHNATPRTFGLELMTHPELRALVPVDHTIAVAARYGEMPLNAIMEALATRTHGVLFRSDGDPKKVAEVAFVFSSKMLSLRTKPDGPLLKRPLHCETSFELEG